MLIVYCCQLNLARVFYLTLNHTLHKNNISTKRPKAHLELFSTLLHLLHVFWYIQCTLSVVCDFDTHMLIMDFLVICLFSFQTFCTVAAAPIYLTCAQGVLFTLVWFRNYKPFKVLQLLNYHVRKVLSRANHREPPSLLQVERESTC